MSSAYPILLWWSWEYVLYLIIIIRSEIWIINHRLWLGHETMVCAVCLTMCFCSYNWQTGISRLSTAAHRTSDFYKQLVGKPRYSKEVWWRCIGVASVGGSWPSEIRHIPNFINVPHISLFNTYRQKLKKTVYNNCRDLTQKLFLSCDLPFSTWCIRLFHEVTCDLAIHHYYNDVTMKILAYQITDDLSVCLAVC